MKTNFVRIGLSLLLIAGCASAVEPDVPRGVPTSTIEQLASDIRKDGFHWKFLGRRIEFTATVKASGPNPKVVIEGMEKGKLDTAALHNPRPDMKLNAGDRIKVSGMIVDEWYSVWQIWCYNIERAK